MSYSVSICIIALLASLMAGCGKADVPLDVVTADPGQGTASFAAPPAMSENDAGAAPQPHRRERVIISVADRYLNRFSEVVARLRIAGLKVERSLQQIGVVAGTIRADKIAALARLEGVAHVEFDRQVRGT